MLQPNMMWKLYNPFFLKKPPMKIQLYTAQIQAYTNGTPMPGSIESEP